MEGRVAFPWLGRRKSTVYLGACKQLAAVFLILGKLFLHHVVAGRVSLHQTAVGSEKARFSRFRNPLAISRFASAVRRRAFSLPPIGLLSGPFGCLFSP